MGEERHTATDPSKGHGRAERRTITTTPWPNEYPGNWPGVEQVFRPERRRKVTGAVTVAVVYGITSPSRLAADAGARRGYSRRHWGIENGLHDTRDVTLGEGRCRVRGGAGTPWHNTRMSPAHRRVPMDPVPGTVTIP